jgi:hypothetical protein
MNDMTHPQFTCDEIQTVCRTKPDVFDREMPKGFRVGIKNQTEGLGFGEVSILAGDAVICTASYNLEEHEARYRHGLGAEAGPQHVGAAIGLMRKAITIAEADLDARARARAMSESERARSALDAYLANKPMPEDEGPSLS